MRPHRQLLPMLCALLGAAARAEEPLVPAAATGAPTSEVQQVHVVERRPFTEAGRWEISGAFAAQVNTRFTSHAGTTLEVAYHLRENLAAQLGFTWFPLAQQSTLTEELLGKLGLEPPSATALLLQGGALLGLELMPVYGKVSVFDGRILRLGAYVSAGLGVGKTRLQLRPSSDKLGSSFGDTGLRPMGGLGLGLRLFLGEQFTVRVELRDLVYSAYVSTVNGCSAAETAQISTSGSSASFADGCSAASFGSSEDEIRSNADLANRQIKSPSADVINNLAASLGVSYLF
jgi:outer membrane beta-barrel protein